MSDVSVDFINSLVQSGSLTTALAVQEAAAEQVNTATTGSTGTDAATTNQAWGKAIPQLIGHTRTVCLPYWTGNPVANITEAGDETDTIDFAVYVGRPGPRAKAASLRRVWFDNVLVYDSADASVTTLTGASLAFTFYDGTQTDPDPTIKQANDALGIATPACTHVMYVVFTKLTTRIINATTTTTQFSKLPEVQCEIEQVPANIKAGAVVYPFKNGSAVPLVGITHFYSNKRALYYVLDAASFATYDAQSNTLLGISKLQRFGASGDDGGAGIHSNMTMSQAGVLIAVGLVQNYYAYDPVSGSCLAYTANKDSRGKYMPESFAQIAEVGSSFFAAVSRGVALFQYVGAEFLACPDFTTDGPAVGGDVITDHITSFADIPACQMAAVMYAAIGTNKLIRVTVTADGSSKTQTRVGTVTNDGSNKDIYDTSRVATLLELSAAETIVAVMLDHHDATKVYVIVNKNNQTSELVTYATFWYWNPSSGGTAPSTISAIFGDFDRLYELSRKNIPYCFPTRVQFDNRDYRFNKVCYTNGNESVLTSLNFANGNFVQYNAGEMFNKAGQDISNNYVRWPRDTIVYGPNDLFFAYNLEFNYSMPVKYQPVSAQTDEAPYTLADLYIDLSLLGDYALGDITCTNMNDTVTGVQLNQSVAFTDLVAQLNAVFRVDMVEQPDGTLLFTRQADKRTSDYIITPDLLLPTSDASTGNTVAIDRVATNELPTVLQLGFINKDYGYQVGSATVKRSQYPAHTAFGDSYLTLSIPVVMDGTTAAYYAGIALFDMWAGKMNFQINLPPMFFFIEPGDFITLVRPSGRADLCKVTEISLGTDRTIAVTLSGVGSLKPVPFMQAANTPGYVPVENLPASYGTFTTPSPAGVYATIVDNAYIPGTIDGTIPMYLASSSPSDFYAKYGSDAPVKIGTTPACVMGLATTALSDPGNVLTSSAEAFSFALIDSTQIVPPVGIIAVGIPGRWEIIQYAGAVINGPTVTLSGLTRGLQATRSSTGGHKVGDYVLVSPAALTQALLPVAQLNKSVTIYAVKPGALPQPTGGITDTLVVSGAAIKPMAPLFAQAARQANGDVVFKWYRQDPSAPVDFFGVVPLSYAPESYKLSFPAFKNNGIVTRTVLATQPAYVYTAAQQAEDGNTAVSRFNVTITQLSAVVGDGLPFKGYVYVQ